MSSSGPVPDSLSGSAWVHFLIVTMCTSANLLLGLVAVLAVLGGYPTLAAWSLLVCVALDATDGALAKRWNVTTAFGAQFDSLADMTSFILAGSVLAFSWLSPHAELALVAAASGLYVLTGAIRLARFNVSGPQAYFTGLPTTFVTLVLSGTYLTAPGLNSSAGVTLVVMLGLLMVSGFPYPKRSFLKKLPVWVWVAVLCSAAVDLYWTLWMAALAYSLSGPVIWVLRKRTEPGA